MRQWKLAVRMIKYSYGIKMNLVAMVLIGVFGTVGGIINGRSSAQLLGTSFFFLALVPMFAVQIWYSMNSCELLRSSAWKKAADTSIPTLLAFFGMLLIYTITAAVVVARGGADDVMQMGALIWMAISAFLIMLLCGACYKYFVVSMIVFFVLYFGGYLMNLYLLMGAQTLRLPAAAVIALGYGLIFAGALGQYLLSCIFYKKNVSKLAQGAALRKYLS